jgi:hypothetical protein
MAVGRAEPSRADGKAELEMAHIPSRSRPGRAGTGRAGRDPCSSRACMGLARKEGGHGEDVLNGIAYDAAGDRLWVTGKLWSRVFRVALAARRRRGRRQ